MKPIEEYDSGEVEFEEICRLGLGFCRIVEPVIEANLDAIPLN